MQETKLQQHQTDRFLRIKQICPDLLPISKASFWAGVADGRYPAPIKLGERTTVWRESEIQKIIVEGIPGEKFPRCLRHPLRRGRVKEAQAYPEGTEKLEDLETKNSKQERKG